MNFQLLRIDLIAVCPEIFDSVLNSSILKIAAKKNLVKIEVHNLHDYASDKYRHIDDTPYGGAAGMLIKCEPVFRCIESLTAERHYDEIIYMSPDGKKLDQSDSNQLSMLKNIIILSGHYKGIDQRIRDRLITREISIGDYVLSGGELASLVLVDSVVRLLPGVISDSESALEDSFQNGLLEAPQYTKPADFRGLTVPDVLLGGNHKLIDKWRQEQSIDKTRKLRPDLLVD
ncbi:MAG: tRNA (guanosine(37)-N1)-methyltransferase TrmD [Candidatus Kapabacteria bacterium]|nr:tRNA (guanosine(37)-N1)-methyltransferase TrmD [Candidatus Kapabacteria bacterium]